MSFRFPKPTTSSPAEPCYNSRDANYAELLSRLSIFGFSKLSVGDQKDQTEEMREKVVEDVIVEQLPKKSDEGFRLRMFTDLLKKLPMAEQNLFLSSVVKIFKHHRRFDELVSWFKKLGAWDQQEVIENMVPPGAVALSFPGETVDDFRLRRFTELCAVYTEYAYFKYRKISDEEGHRDGRTSDEDSPEVSDDEATYEDKDQDNVVKMSRFDEFFLGFSVVWFEGQSWDNQGQLIDQLCDGVKGVIIEKLPNESMEEFRLRKFTDLCKMVEDHDFVIQERFLDIAEKVLWKETCPSLPYGKLLQPQDSASAAELCLRDTSFGERCQSLPHGELLQPQDSASAAGLCMRLTSFGFSLLPTLDQRHQLKVISEFVHGGGKKMKRLANESSAEFRVRKFMELSPSRRHFSMFKEFTDKFFLQRQLHESISIFRQLGSKDQQDLTEKMFKRLMEKVRSHQYMNQGTTSSDDTQDEDDPIVLYMGGVETIQDMIVEKLHDESEENFRLRRFITMCSKHPILFKTLVRSEAGKCARKGTLLHSSNNDQEIEEIKEYRYAEFYLGLSIIWFKARCADISRNPIQVLFGEVEADRLIEKVPDESEEDFKLRRFTESFKQLPFSSQEKFVKYIRKTLSDDIGEKFHHDRTSGYAEIHSVPFEPSSFHDELIKVRIPNLRGGPPIKTTNELEGKSTN